MEGLLRSAVNRLGGDNKSSSRDDDPDNRNDRHRSSERDSGYGRSESGRYGNDNRSSGSYKGYGDRHSPERDSGYARPSSGRYGDDDRPSYSKGGYSGNSSYESDRRSDRYAEEGYGYGGHGGRPGDARHDSDDGSLFSKVRDLLSGKEKELRDEDLDEERLVKSHKDVYRDSGSSKTTGNGIAEAAALQALKMFTGGGSEKKKEEKVASQGDFVTLAMKEAVSMFDKQKAQGNLRDDAKKDDVVTMAAKIALKLFLKSKADQSSAGNGGGAGQLLSLASAFFNK
ncbi:hypothetical protein EX30DRAFT_339944 [Ascodesmis nigricans]|uniref:DUF7721 domain-containing protein n=1 Tax=Ascodesmis nigricans TaxID=341454 RepID=A0A4S2MZ14_9PEZI|nr:hypothetical protein EX30DRAFT_339944 [Ascodesmis nigricans]